MNPHYTDYAELLGRLFPGQKVQKLSVDAGHGCPNRDGTIGRGGCIYCNNETFSPGYVRMVASVAEQLERGKEFFARKYPQQKYLAYFQSYTSTHCGLEQAVGQWREALSVPGVVGLVVGTRPDCMPDALLAELARINASGTPVIVEFGAETMHDRTLRLINRGHSAAQTLDAVQRTSAAGLSVSLHLIMGLPGESEEEMLQTVRQVCALPVDSLKFHQLQVVKGTPLHTEYLRQQTGQASDMPAIRPFGVKEYINLCVKIIDLVPRRIAIERFTASAPASLLVAPAWGLKNYQFTNLLRNALTGR